VRFNINISEKRNENAATFQDLGDILRGHRASMGKTLINIEDEIGLRPWIIHAIESGDLRAFANPGLIGGYVRQYARYLNMNPDEVHELFCELTGHVGQAATAEKRYQQAKARRRGKTVSGHNWMFNQPSLFRLLFGNISMIGVVTASSLVVFLAAAGYASLTLYNYFKLLPVSDTTLRIAQIEFGDVDADPRSLDISDAVPGAALAPGGLPSPKSLEAIGDLQPAEWVEKIHTTNVNFSIRSNDSTKSAPLSLEEGDRGYNPLDPATSGLDLLPVLQAMNPPVEPALAKEVRTATSDNAIPAGTVVIHPVLPAWIKVQDSDGKVYIERILDKGERYTVPSTNNDLYLRSGMSGYVYFLVDHEIYGPAGSGGRVVKDVSLDPDTIAAVYADRNLGTNPDILATLD